jgi:predicted aspartyl protease
MRDVVKLITIKLPPKGIHLIVNAKINNRSARLVLDTGASQTVLDLNRISRFTKELEFRKHDAHSSGIGSDTMVSHIFHADKFKIGKINIENIELVLIDMIHVNNSYNLLGKKAVDGVLGGDVLKSLNAVINYKSRTLHISKKK